MPATRAFLQAHEIAYEVVDKQILLPEQLHFDDPPEEIADAVEDEQNSDDEYDDSSDDEDGGPDDMEGLIWPGPLDAVIHQFSHAFDIAKPIMNRNFRKVFAAFRKSDRRPVVIVIAKDFNKAQVQNGVPREVMLMTRVRNHPNVAQLLGWKRVSKHSYAMLLEHYLECGLQTCFYSKYLISEYMRGLLEGLHYLQARRVCHRDIAPQNIMWDPLRKCARIIDLDTACISRATGYMREVGRADYDAPEKYQVFRDVKDANVDPRHIRPYSDIADVYSAGVIFWMLLLKVEEPPKPYKLQKWIAKAVERRRHRQYAEFDLLAKMLLPDPRKRISVQEALQHGFFQSYPADQTYLEIEDHLFTLLNYEESCQDEGDEADEGDEGEPDDDTQPDDETQDQKAYQDPKVSPYQQHDPYQEHDPYQQNEDDTDEDEEEWSLFKVNESKISQNESHVGQESKVVDLGPNEDDLAFLDFLNKKPSDVQPVSCASEDGQSLERVELGPPVFHMDQVFQVGIICDSQPMNPKSSNPKLPKPRKPIRRSYQ